MGNGELRNRVPVCITTKGNGMRVSVGDLAPDFELADHAGEPWRLRAHRGRPVILVFHRHLM